MSIEYCDQGDSQILHNLLIPYLNGRMKIREVGDIFRCRQERVIFYPPKNFPGDYLQKLRAHFQLNPDSRFFIVCSFQFESDYFKQRIETPDQLSNTEYIDLNHWNKKKNCDRILEVLESD